MFSNYNRNDHFKNIILTKKISDSDFNDSNGDNTSFTPALDKAIEYADLTRIEKETESGNENLWNKIKSEISDGPLPMKSRLTSASARFKKTEPSSMLRKYSRRSLIMLKLKAKAKADNNYKINDNKTNFQVNN